MNEHVMGSIIAICIASVAIVAAVSVSSCQIKMNEGYYKLQSECIGKGGSWELRSYGSGCYVTQVGER